MRRFESKFVRVVRCSPRDLHPGDMRPTRWFGRLHRKPNGSLTKQRRSIAWPLKKISPAMAEWVPWMGGHEEIDGFRERMVDRIRMDAGLTSIPSMYPNERVVSVRSPCDEAPDWAEIVAQRNREIDGFRLSEISLPCWAIAEAAASPRRSHAKTRLSFCCAALMPKVVLSLAMRVLRRLRGAEPTV